MEILCQDWTCPNQIILRIGTVLVNEVDIVVNLDLHYAEVNGSAIADGNRVAQENHRCLR